MTTNQIQLEIFLKYKRLYNKIGWWKFKKKKSYKSKWENALHTLTNKKTTT